MEWKAFTCVALENFGESQDMVLKENLIACEQARFIEESTYF